jgi:deoxyribodipyrimidine photo-lyase
MNSGYLAPERIQALRDGEPTRGAYVLYWMQQSQRATFNHALEFAVRRANELRLPVLVGFGLTDNYPEANVRHHQFMLEGLVETAVTLRQRGIAFALRLGDPADVALALSQQAALVVCDRGYLRHQKAWRARVAAAAPCPVWQVESDVVVPTDLASTKQEIGARTLRPKIARLWEDFLTPLKDTPVERRVDRRWLTRVVPDAQPLEDVPALIARLKLDRSVGPVSHHHRGGSSHARERLQSFVEETLPGYKERRQQPEAGAVSRLSPYLHFGQISPIEVALAVRAARPLHDDNRASYLDELVIRRELAVNFVHTNPAYDRYEAVPAWARATLLAHVRDARPFLYAVEELERAETHDPYWNAAQLQMVRTGYMHNQMRMYWGKQILAWTPTPQEAYAVTMMLNNKYFVDGRDPNAYTNVAWIFGLHDRPWPERAIYGKVRSMTASGLERKTDIAAYVQQVAELSA